MLPHLDGIQDDRLGYSFWLSGPTSKLQEHQQGMLEMQSLDPKVFLSVGLVVCGVWQLLTSNA